MTEARAERIVEGKARDAVATWGRGKPSNDAVGDSGKRDRSDSMFTCCMGGCGRAADVTGGSHVGFG